MKMLIVSLNYSPEPTATGKYTGEMAEFLATRGHQVEVIAAPPHYPQWKIFEAYRKRGFYTEFRSGVKVYRVPCFIPGPALLRGSTRILMELSFTFLSSYYWLFKILFDRCRYDVVIAVCPPMQTIFFPLLYRKLKGVPFVFHVQDFQVDMAFRLNILRKNFFNRMLYRVESWLLNQASYVSTITSAMVNRAREKGVDNKQLILFPNWSNIDHVRPQLRYNQLRSDLGYTTENFIVLYSGGMGAKQGLELIIEAADLTVDNSNIKYLIVGDGGAKAGLVELAVEKGLKNVHFLPLQPYEKLPELLALSNVNLIVQKAEAADLVMPSKLTNILAAGRAVIATTIEGTELAEVIVENKIGLISPPGDAKSLTEAIFYLASDQCRCDVMGVAAREYAEKNLDKDKILSRFEEQLQLIALRKPLFFEGSSILE